jgi:hypothetical protein
MKKTISLIAVAVMLLGIVLFTLPAADGGIDTSYNGDDGSSDPGKGTAIYQKRKDWCDPEKKTKTEYSCLAYGSEQCKVQNCP